MSNSIIAQCRKISMSHFLNTPYKGQDIKKIYAVDGFANKASKICHYCTINTLKNILDKECLRFSDVRFLNDSTEFVEVIRLIRSVLSERRYTSGFKKLILESTQMKELKEYIINKMECFFSSDEHEIFDDNGSIEHILPEKNGGLALNIGNLILLEYSLNNDAGETEYEAKKSIYLKSKYTWIAEFMGQHSTWSVNEIIQRAEKMADIYYHQILKRS